MTDKTTDLVSQLRLVRPRAKYEYAKDQFLMIGVVMREAADEIERLERERSEWAGVAATRNLNIALIAEERDRLRTALEAIAAFNPGDFRPLKDEVAIWRLATDALKRTVDVSDDGKCWIKGCQQPKGHAGFCDPLPDPRK